MTKSQEASFAQMEAKLNEAIATRRVGTIRVALAQLKVLRKSLESGEEPVTSAGKASKSSITPVTVPFGTFLHTDNPGFSKRVQKWLSGKS